MTIDTKHGRELLAKATPGEWHATHYEGIGYRVWKEHPSPTPGYATVTITDGQWNEADGDLIVWLRNNCAALLDAAEFKEQWISNTLVARCEAAERRVAELEAKSAQLAHEGEVLGALYVGDAPPKDAARALVERARAAERARDEALADFLAVAEVADLVHHQSMGPLLPPTRDELVDRVRAMNKQAPKVDAFDAISRHFKLGTGDHALANRDRVVRLATVAADVRDEAVRTRDEALRRAEAAEGAIRAYLSAHEGPFPSAEIKARQGMRDVLATLDPKGVK